MGGALAYPSPHFWKADVLRHLRVRERRGSLRQLSAYLGLRRPLNAIPADEMWHDFSRKSLARKVPLLLAACAHAITSLPLRSLLRKRGAKGSDLSKLK